MLSKFSLLVSFVKSAVKMISVLFVFPAPLRRRTVLFMKRLSGRRGGAFRNGTSKGFAELSEGTKPS